MNSSGRGSKPQRPASGSFTKDARSSTLGPSTSPYLPPLKPGGSVPNYVNQTFQKPPSSEDPTRPTKLSYSFSMAELDAMAANLAPLAEQREVAWKDMVKRINDEILQFVGMSVATGSVTPAELIAQLEGKVMEVTGRPSETVLAHKMFAPVFSSYSSLYAQMLGVAIQGVKKFANIT